MTTPLCFHDNFNNMIIISWRITSDYGELFIDLYNNILKGLFIMCGNFQVDTLYYMSILLELVIAVNNSQSW